MTLHSLTQWMRKRNDEPVLELSAHEAGTISEPMPADLMFRLTREEKHRYHASLQARVALWSRELWGRSCAYDKDRDVFVLTR